MRPAYLEAYLQRDPPTVDKYQLLWQFYVKDGQPLRAAQVLNVFAESIEFVIIPSPPPKMKSKLNTLASPSHFLSVSNISPSPLAMPSHILSPSAVNMSLPLPSSQSLRRSLMSPRCSLRSTACCYPASKNQRTRASSKRLAC